MMDDDLIQNGPPQKLLLYKIAIGIYLIPLSLTFLGFVLSLIGFFS